MKNYNACCADKGIFDYGSSVTELEDKVQNQKCKKKKKGDQCRI